VDLPLEDSEIHFDTAGYETVKSRIGEDGVAMVPLLHSPLKLLHVIAGLENACLLLADDPEGCEALFEVYTAKVMKLADECCRSSAEVFMTMDNLDSLSHSPRLLKKHCLKFYQDLGDKLRSSGKLLFSHACGQLKKICPEIRDSRMDGLEGIAPPPLGDLPIHEALAISDSFIANGGMTVHTLEKNGADAAARIDDYTRELFASIKPHANRFLYSSGCNTSITTPLDNLKRWRDAVWKHGKL
jgi:uroporphyrinogen-III decarboxylase